MVLWGKKLDQYVSVLLQLERMSRKLPNLMDVLMISQPNILSQLSLSRAMLMLIKGTRSEMPCSRNSAVTGTSYGWTWGITLIIILLLMESLIYSLMFFFAQRITQKLCTTFSASMMTPRSVPTMMLSYPPSFFPDFRNLHQLSILLPHVLQMIM